MSPNAEYGRPSATVAVAFGRVPFAFGYWFGYFSPATRVHEGAVGR